MAEKIIYITKREIKTSRVIDLRLFKIADDKYLPIAKSIINGCQSIRAPIIIIVDSSKYIKQKISLIGWELRSDQIAGIPDLYDFEIATIMKMFDEQH